MKINVAGDITFSWQLFLFLKFCMLDIKLYALNPSYDIPFQNYISDSVTIK